MGFHLHPLHTAYARFGVTRNADNAAGRFHIGAAGDQVVGHRRIRRYREAPVPELAVQMLRVVALHTLAGTKPEVHRTPGRKKGRHRTHIGLWCTAAAQAHGHARVARRVGHALGAHALQAFGNQIKRLVP